MKKILMTLVLLGTSFSFAQVSTYKVDLNNSEISQDDKSYIESECIKQFKIDISKNVAEQIVKNISMNLVDVKMIEKSKYYRDGSQPALSGDMLKRVYLVGNKYSGYDLPVYHAVTVEQFGRSGTNELKGFNVVQKLLNYYESAELAEGSICSNLSYIKSK